MITSPLLRPLPPLERFELSDEGKVVKEQIESAFGKMNAMLQAERTLVATASDRHLKLVGLWGLVPMGLVVLSGLLVLVFNNPIHFSYVFLSLALFIVIQYPAYRKVVRAKKEYDRVEKEIRTRFGDYLRDLARKHATLIGDLRTAEGCLELSWQVEKALNW